MTLLRPPLSYYRPYLERSNVWLRIPAEGLRAYASQTSAGASRKQVTLANDDGRVQWKDLSRREKAARTTQQTFNFGLIITGIVMTGGVIYLLYTEVFSLDSKTRHFNRAVDRVRADTRALDLLGSGHKIRAFGEPTWNKLARARPIASQLRKDRSGAEHLLMHFNVEGSERAGVVNLHMIKKPEEAEFEYKYLTLNVKGHPVVYLENTDAIKEKKKPGFSLFGVQWR